MSKLRNLGGQTYRQTETYRRKIHSQSNPAHRSVLGKHLSLCSGMKQYHPIMSKLRDLGGQTYRQKETDILILIINSVSLPRLW